jgi:hypothetical protein
MGETLSPTTVEGLQTVLVHPTKADWMLGFLAKDPTAEVFTVVVSQDYGRTWRTLWTDVRQAEWGIVPDLEKKKETVYYVRKEESATGQANRLYKADLGGSSKRLADHVTGFTRRDTLLMISQRDGDGDRILVYKAESACDVDPTLPRCLAHIGDNHPPFHAYRILASTADAVFLRLDVSGDVYVSGPNATHYTRSLANVPCLSVHCDFHQVSGVDGVYIANSRAASGIVTMISLTNGASWQTVTPPVYDSARSKISCGGKCALHLHGVSTNMMARLYSSPSATGVVMASGNVGQTLDVSLQNVNTYISRDAGVTWKEVAKGAHAFDIGDHGALIVMADNSKPTTKIQYSWNEGGDFKDFPFAEKGVEVVNVFTQETGYSQIFFVYGVQDGHGVIAQLDFESFHKRACAGIADAGKPDSDYELWVRLRPQRVRARAPAYTHPHARTQAHAHTRTRAPARTRATRTQASASLRDGQCLLGKNVTFTRRKADR